MLLGAARLSRSWTPISAPGIFNGGPVFHNRDKLNCLLWNAKTFGRTVVQCLFVHWNALAAANQRIWETSYVPRALYAPWESWQAWMAEYRTLVATVQEVYEAQYGQKHDGQ